MRISSVLDFLRRCRLPITNPPKLPLTPFRSSASRKHLTQIPNLGLWTRSQTSGRGSEPCRMRLTERVSKRIDYAKERGAQGRSLNTAVRELARLIEPVAQQHGIDLQARLKRHQREDQKSDGY